MKGLKLTILTYKYPRARKNHICQVCGCAIPKGTEHHFQTSAFDGSVYSWRVHSDCAEMHWHHNDGREYDDQCDDYYLDEYRGFWPHSVNRIEYRIEMAERRWREARK